MGGRWGSVEGKFSPLLGLLSMSFNSQKWRAAVETPLGKIWKVAPYQKTEINTFVESKSGQIVKISTQDLHELVFTLKILKKLSPGL